MALLLPPSFSYLMKMWSSEFVHQENHRFSFCNRLAHERTCRRQSQSSTKVKKWISHWVVWSDLSSTFIMSSLASSSFSFSYCQSVKLQSVFLAQSAANRWNVLIKRFHHFIYFLLCCTTAAWSYREKKTLHLAQLFNPSNLPLIYER